MTGKDKSTHQDRLKGILHANGKTGLPPNKEIEAEEEISCGKAFGFLRGVRSRRGQSRSRAPVHDLMNL